MAKLSEIQNYLSHGYEAGQCQCPYFMLRIGKPGHKAHGHLQVKLMPEQGQGENKSRTWKSLRDQVATATQSGVGWQHQC